MFPRAKPHGEKKNFHRIMNIGGASFPHFFWLPMTSENNKIDRRDTRSTGKKRLPDAEKKHGHETFWASIEGVGDDLDVLRDELKQKEYETKTRGNLPIGISFHTFC